MIIICYYNIRNKENTTHRRIKYGRVKKVLRKITGYLKRNEFNFKLEKGIPKMQIEYSKTAVKFINKMDRPTKQRIKAAIEGLTEQPPKGDIKTLQGYTDGRKRLRVGKYRIIYNYLPNGEIEILYIMDIDSRGDIYK